MYKISLEHLVNPKNKRHIKKEKEARPKGLPLAKFEYEMITVTIITHWKYRKPQIQTNINKQIESLQSNRIPK